MFRGEPDQARFGGPGRRHLRQQVAFALGRSAQVGEQEVALLLVDSLGGDQPQRRDPHALLPGLRRRREIAAGPGPADVAPVGEADGKGEQPSLQEDRSSRASASW